MEASPVNLSLRILLSCMGLFGNIFLILSITRETKFSRVKSFDFFLLGLAIANLEEILIINIYDLILIEVTFSTGTLLCRTLKFLTLFGEVSSILFTVLICIFRYQKLRDSNKRGSLPICLDSIRSAWLVSGVCVMLSLLFSLPVFVINLHGSVANVTNNRSNCPPDFFQCGKNVSPFTNCFYKYTFVTMCNLLPLIIVTATSCLIITVLLSQRKRVALVSSVSRSSQTNRKNKGPGLQQSMIAILAAMTLFQVDWTLYLIFQLIYIHNNFSFLGEIEFFISTSYTSISPYMYGIGNNIFSLKSLIKK